MNSRIGFITAMLITLALFLPVQETQSAPAGPLQASLSWNAFLGGNGSDYGRNIAADGSGNTLVTGDSSATWGDPKRTFSADRDVFVAKLDASGNLVWNTFLGGSGDDYGFSIALDGDRNIYLSGFSTAAWGTPRRAFTGSEDAFAARLDASGNLLWNTFLGGSGVDNARSGAIDGNGNYYVAGYSNATWGSPLRAYTGGYDAFVAKLNASGNLSWHSFLGGSGDDYSFGVAADTGNVYLAGQSTVAWGSPVRSYANGYDAYAAKLSSSGNLTWNTFLGGGGDDSDNDIVVDGSGNIYVAGQSDDTWGNLRRDHTGDYDAYAARLDASGNLIWNTFLGGGGPDYGVDIASGGGSVYAAGWSSTTWDSPVRAYTGGWDMSVARLDASGALAQNTFLGGSADDHGYGLAVDGNGNVFAAGYSPATWGSPIRAYTGGWDAFAAKVNFAPPIALSISRADANPTAAPNVNFSVTFSEPVTGVDPTDFALTTAGLVDASIVGVSGAGTTCNVAVNTGSGDGTLRLDLSDDNTIVDAASNPLGGTAVGDGDFQAGEIYTVEPGRAGHQHRLASCQSDKQHIRGVYLLRHRQRRYV